MAAMGPQRHTILLDHPACWRCGNLGAVPRAEGTWVCVSARPYLHVYVCAVVTERGRADKVESLPVKDIDEDEDE